MSIFAHKDEQFCSSLWVKVPVLLGRNAQSLGESWAKPWGVGKKHDDTPYHSLYFLPRYMQIPFCCLLTLTPNAL
mgnify:CR=1 FL=1